MDELIRRLKTPDACMRFVKNVQDTDPDLARIARRRAIELRANAHGTNSEVEIELLKAVYAYEDALSEKNRRRTRASRTWQMIKRHGIIIAAEKAVNRNIETMGFQTLVDLGMPDFTFEAVIVRYPNVFSQESVERAKMRLEEMAII